MSHPGECVVIAETPAHPHPFVRDGFERIPGIKIERALGFAVHRGEASRRRVDDDFHFVIVAPERNWCRANQTSAARTGGSGNWIDLESFASGVTWVRNEDIALFETADYLQAIAVIAANLNVLDMHRVVRAD